MVFQDFRLLDHMSLYENVALPLRVMGRHEDTYRDEVIELLKWVDLGERMWRCRRWRCNGEAQRSDRACGDRAAATAAGRRADRQRRSDLWRNACCG